MDIAHRLRYLRRLRGYTVEDVANLTGLPRTTIYRYETDYVDGMSIDRIEPIAKALNVTPAYFMGWNMFAGNIITDDTAPNRLMMGGAHSFKVMERDPDRPGEFTNKNHRMGAFVCEGLRMPDSAIVVDADDLGGSLLCSRCVAFLSEHYQLTSGKLYAITYNSALRIRRYTKIKEGIILTAVDPKIPPKYFNNLTKKKVRFLGEVVGLQYLID